MKIVHWMVFLILLTSSFDLFLISDVGGANLRISQILLVLVMIIACAQIVQSKAILWPRGGTALILWCVIQAIMISQSGAPIPSLELYCLLMVSIVGVFAILQIYGRSFWIGSLFKGYMVSFVCIAAFGLFQLTAPALHLGQPFIAQWIIHGTFPRINGFCYEPSFYATYLIMGWITLVDLRISKATVVSGRTWYWLTWMVSLSLFLSTSKIAWVLMIVEGCARLAPAGKKLILQQVRRIPKGTLRVPLPRPRTLAWTAVSLISAAMVLVIASRFTDLNVFLAGSGLNNTPAHSVNTRMEQFGYTVRVLREHPWVGRSLGGVAARIGDLRDAPVHSAADLKINWGFPVPVDVLAASGAIGILPFIWFFLAISFGERKLMQASPQDDRSKWLHALIRALLYEWLCLSVDQNLVRMYLWLHVSVLVTVGYNLRYTMRHEPVSQKLVSA